MHEGSTDPRLMQELRSATDLTYGHRKSRRSHSGRWCPHLWPKSASLAQPCWDERCRQSALSRLSRLPGWAVWRYCRGLCTAVLGSTEADRGHPTHLAQAWCTNLPPLCRGAGLSLLIAVGALLRPPDLLCPVLNCHLGRRVKPLAGARRPLCPSWPRNRPGRRQSGPDMGNPEMWEAALSQETARTALLLPPEEGRVENLLFSVLPVTTLSKKEQFPFPPGSQTRRLTVGRRNASPCISGQSPQGLGEFCEDESERDAFCTIQLYSPPLHHRGYIDCSFGATCKVSGCVACTTQPVPLAHSHNSTRLCDSVCQANPKFSCVLETSVAVRDAPVLRKGIAVLLAKDAIKPVPPAEMRQGFHSPYFIVPKKGGSLWPILDLRVLNRALHKLPFKMLMQKRIIRCIHLLHASCQYMFHYVN